ncbi:hypothetical protein [Alkalihalobacillus sp. BA299]|uniref:hypothetical protein n=1 Tax=Alkalihalobacillus sp. BA299 TaxID=2815938 RepID=UPI001ADCE388|nr:hypothetical protein [Alkalihalobacillus sp. BA299]
MSGERKPEDYLHLLAEHSEDYIKNLKAGYTSTNKELSEKLIWKNMCKYIGQNIRTLAFWVKLVIPFVTGGTLWIPFYPFNVMTTEGKVIISGLIVVATILYWRKATINLMRQPSNKDFFNLGAYEKYNKEEFDAFSLLISDGHFSFKKIKDDLKTPSISQKHNEITDARIEEQKIFLRYLTETIRQKDKEITKLNIEIKELNANIKKHESSNEEVKEEIDNLMKTIRSLEKEKEIYTRIVDNTQKNLQMFADKDFSSDVLDDLQFDYHFSIYEFQVDKSFKYITSKGPNKHLLPKEIKHSERNNTIIKANKRKGETTHGDEEIVKVIPVSETKVMAVQLHLTDEQIDILNDDLHHLNKTTRINIEATFRLFWVCLLIQQSVNELKTNLKGAENE